MDKVCFFCTTPYQIITAIHLITMNEEKAPADLYVVNRFLKAEEVAFNVNETNVFSNVVVVKEESLINNVNKSKFYIWIQILMSYCLINQKAKKILQENLNVHYDKMYISSKAFVPRLAALYFAKKDENVEIIYFDDGVGSYYDKDILYPRKTDKIVRKMLFRKKTHNADPKKILLYSPDLFFKANINVCDEIKVEEIPKWNCNPKLKEITNLIFGYSNNDYINESIIIFDGLYSGEKRKTLDEFYEKITNIAGTANVIIKKHPRDKNVGNENLKYFNRPDLPFELMCLNMDMKGKLLIGVATTAVVTPALLLDEEPFVLVLNDLPEFSASTDWDFKDFKALYKNPSHFCVAENLNGAVDFVKNFMNFDFIHSVKNNY